MTKLKRTSLFLPADLIESLTAEATANSQSLGETIRQHLTRYTTSPAFPSDGTHPELDLNLIPELDLESVPTLR